MAISNVTMDTEYIFEADMDCQCGYHADVCDGILLTPNRYEGNDDTPDVHRLMYNGLAADDQSFSERIRRLALGFTGVNEEFLEDLMVVLLEADIGIRTAQKIVDEVESRAMDQKLKSFDESANV